MTWLLELGAQVFIYHLLLVEWWMAAFSPYGITLLLENSAKGIKGDLTKKELRR